MDIKSVDHLNQEGHITSNSSTVGANLRQTLFAEIECMILFLMSEGKEVGPRLASELAKIDQEETIALDWLITIHGKLSQSIAPAKPRAVLSLQQQPSVGGFAGIFGPMPGVRRLNCASLFFAAAFFLISLSGNINIETMSMSIYQLSGYPLAIKLGLIVSAAGLGASFATLFSVWEDLRRHRFEPLAESASWMQIGLGIVAGLMLSEIIGPEQRVGGTALGMDADASGISEPLLALVGGFSAGVIHLILLSIVNGFRRAFGQEHNVGDSAQTSFRTEISSRTSGEGDLPLSTPRATKLESVEARVPQIVNVLEPR